MAFTRKMLKAMGIEEEKIEEIIEAHTEVTGALKAERDDYKAKADELSGVQKELDDLKAKPDDGYKAKYEAEKKAHDDYKAEVEAEKVNAQKSELYKKMLAGAGIDPKRIDAVLKVTDLADVTIEDGKLKDADKLAESAKEEWSAFIIKSGTEGANVDNPPAGGSPAPTAFGSLTEALHDKYKL